MSGSFGIESGQIVIKEGSRTVLSTSGTLINALPTDFSDTVSVAFPDFDKDYLYRWTWVNDYNSSGDDALAEDNACSSLITVVPQEWSSTTVITSAPTGADFFAGRVRISRTNSPSHSWGGSTISVLPIQNQWIPFSGSILVEAELGMARSFSIYISGGNLVLYRQQSVSTYPGGYQSWSNAVAGPNLGPPDGNGGENVYNNTRGIPVVPIETRNSAATFYTQSQIGPIIPRYKETHRIGGSQACSTSLSTNFSSTYSVEIIGKFGRKS